MTLLQKARRLLFPQVQCLACNEPRNINPGDPLCDGCAVELQKLKLNRGICRQCLSPKRYNEPCAYCTEGGMRHISAAYSNYRYRAASQRLVVALKFRGVFRAAEPLVQGMLDSLPGTSFDALVPISLHKNRLRQRGFDQAELLARKISAVCNYPVLIAMKRIKDTKPQSTLTPEQREQNMRDSFTVVQPVQGMRLLLVDDVRTTGCTARACASELLAAGAREVSLLTATVASPYKKRSSSDITAR